MSLERTPLITGSSRRTADRLGWLVVVTLTAIAIILWTVDLIQLGRVLGR